MYFLQYLHLIKQVGLTLLKVYYISNVLYTLHNVQHHMYQFSSKYKLIYNYIRVVQMAELIL